MRNVYLTIALVLGIFFQLNAAVTTWTGVAGTSDWNDPINWSNGVPGFGDDVVIDGDADIPAELSTTTTVASVDIINSGILNITASGILNLNGNIGVNGNQGAIDISSSGGIINNDGAINITNTLGDGIYLNGTFNNNGAISIVGAADDGIVVRNSFNNGVNGTITISNLNGGGSSDGIIVDNDNATLGNLINDGVINIDMGNDDDGIDITDGSTLTNNGSLTITDGDFGIITRNGGTFKNGADGNLSLTATGNDSVHIQSGSTLDNCGNILITDAGTGLGNPDGSSNHALELEGTYTNSGTFKAIDSESDGINIEGGDLSNTGVMTFDGYGSEAIENEGSNGTSSHAGGTLNIGCAGTITDLELKCDQDLGAACIVFDIFGTAGAGAAGGNDLIENFGGSATGCTGTLDISTTTAKINWGTYLPTPGECFTLVDGSGLIAGAGLFGAVSSTIPVTQASQNSASEIEICVDAVLSVDLTNFAAVKTDRGAQLNWMTASEENNEGFDIERSLDGQNWSKIAFFRGNENSTTSKRYDYLDTTPAEGINYYRLKQIDLDGRYAYSEVVSLEFNNKTTETTIAVYPNPVNEMLYIKLAQESELLEIQLFDSAGKLLFTSNNTVQIPFDAYDSGIYVLKVRNGSEQIIQKIIK